MTFSVSPSVKFRQRDRGNAQLYSRAKSRRKHTKKKGVLFVTFSFFFFLPICVRSRALEGSCHIANQQRISEDNEEPNEEKQHRKKRLR